MGHVKGEEWTLFIDDVGMDGEGRLYGLCMGCPARGAGPGAAHEGKEKLWLWKASFGAFAFSLSDRAPLPPSRPCGGCQIQALSYKKQLSFKADKVRGNLSRLGRTHSIIPVEDCLLGPKVNGEVLAAVLSYMREYQVPAYDEETGGGALREAL